MYLNNHVYHMVYRVFLVMRTAILAEKLNLYINQQQNDAYTTTN